MDNLNNYEFGMIVNTKYKYVVGIYAKSDEDVSSKLLRYFGKDPTLKVDGDILRYIATHYTFGGCEKIDYIKVNGRFTYRRANYEV